MAPLSILPGRIRFENRFIAGRRYICKRLQQYISDIKGVTEASVNHRTGRVLVRYDEEQIDSGTLTQYIKHNIEQNKDRTAGCYQVLEEKENSKEPLTTGTTIHALMGIIAHAVLPMPLSVLAEIAIIKAATRGKQVDCLRCRFSLDAKGGF